MKSAASSAGEEKIQSVKMSQVEKKLQKLLTEGKKRNHDHGLDINFSDYDPNL